MKVADFFAVITLKGGGEAVNTLNKLVSASIGVKSALLSAATSLYQVSDAARQSAVFLDKYQLSTGLSAIQLQKLSFQAAQAGVSMGELGGTIEKLQQMNARARLGYGWDPIFTRFGLTPGQDPVAQLNRISNAIRRLQSTNPAEAKALATKAGISDSMYYAILRGSNEQMDKQFILTQKEQQALVKLNQQWNKFWFYLKQITIKIQALSATFQTGLMLVLIRAAKGFYELFLRIYKTIEASDQLKYAIIALGVALALAFAPELLLLGAIALALEDIFTYFEGGDSITGRLIKWCKESEKLRDIWKGIKTVFDMVKGTFLALGEIWKEKIWPMLNELVDSKAFPVIKYVLDRLTDPLGSALQDIGRVKSFIDENRVDVPRNNIGMNSSNTQNITNNTYMQSTGDARRDGEIVGQFSTSVAQAQAQQPALSQGGVKAAYRAGTRLAGVNL